MGFVWDLLEAWESCPSLGVRNAPELICFHHLNFGRGDQGGQREGTGPKSEAVKGRARHYSPTCPSCPLFRATHGLWIVPVVTLDFTPVREYRSNTSFWYPQGRLLGNEMDRDHHHHPRSLPLAHGIRARGKQTTGALSFSNLLKAEWGIHLGRCPKLGFEGSSSQLLAPSEVQAPGPSIFSIEALQRELQTPIHLALA